MKEYKERMQFLMGSECKTDIEKYKLYCENTFVNDSFSKVTFHIKSLRKTKSKLGGNGKIQYKFYTLHAKIKYEGTSCLDVIHKLIEMIKNRTV